MMMSVIRSTRSLGGVSSSCSVPPSRPARTTMTPVSTVRPLFFRCPRNVSHADNSSSWPLHRRSRGRRPIHAGPHVQRRARPARDPRLPRRAPAARHHVRDPDCLLDRIRDKLYRRSDLPRSIGRCVEDPVGDPAGSRCHPMRGLLLPPVLAQMVDAHG